MNSFYSAIHAINRCLMLLLLLFYKCNALCFILQPMCYIWKIYEISVPPTYRNNFTAQCMNQHFHFPQERGRQGSKPPWIIAVLVVCLGMNATCSIILGKRKEKNSSIHCSLVDKIILFTKDKHGNRLIGKLYFNALVVEVKLKELLNEWKE